MKHTAKYPTHFFALLKIKLPFSIHFDNWREAHSVAQDIYGFREALRADEHPDAEIMEKMFVKVVQDRNKEPHGATLTIEQIVDPFRSALLLATEAPSPPATSTPPIAAIDDKK